MWRDIGPSRQSQYLSLLAILMSLAVGLGVPLLQSSPMTRHEQVTWSLPSPTSSATSAEFQGVAPEMLDVDAFDGALLAWQEPGHATPSSIPPPSSIPDPTLSPLADAPRPTWTASVEPTDSPSRTVTAIPTPEPMATATLSPTARPAGLASSTPPSTVSIPLTPQPTESPRPVATPTAAGVLTPPDTSAVVPAPKTSDLLVLPTRRPSMQPPIDGLPSFATPVRVAADVTAADPPASALLANGSTAAPAVAKPTPPAASVAQPAVVTPPALLSPGAEARLSGVVQFVWHLTSTLPPGASYEMVVWSPEQDPSQAWGVAPSRIATSLTLNLDELFRSGRFREGSLYWTVLVVEENPYRRLTQPAESERRYLVLATGG